MHVLIYSIALILIIGFLFSSLFIRLQLPGLLGLILTGILLGPFGMDLMAPELLAISADIRKIALIVILVRAGLTMELGDLKKIGRPAILMTFLPATFEILAVTLLAPKLLGITLLESAILGTVLGAVSPAVVVPRMIMLIESGYGKAKGIPQMILAGASVDDVYVIVLFTSFMGMYTGSGFQAITLLSVPVSIALGLLGGLLVGLGLVFLFRTFHIRDTMKVMLVLSASFLLVTAEDSLAKFIPFSGLLGVMAVGATLLKRRPELAKRLNDKFAKIWSAAEIFLFVLVGSAVDISALGGVGFAAQGLTLDFKLHNLAVGLVKVCGQRVNLGADKGGGLVYKVNCLIRQETFGNIARAQLSGSFKGSVADIQAMMFFIIGAQAMQNFDCFFNTGLIDHNRLETTL